MCLVIYQCLQQVNMMSISLANVKSLPVLGQEKEFISLNILCVCCNKSYCRVRTNLDV